MPCSNIRFLVVEDHPVQRRLLAALLSSLGAAAVHQAEDGAGALEVIRDPARPVDIVVSDVAMPGMDGMELVRHLAAMPSAPAVILTSALEPSVLAAVANMAVAYGVRLLGVLGKPVSAVKLVPLVTLFKDMQGALDREGATLAEIAEALSRGEFEAVYAPRASLASAEVVGLHALPRWRHPVRGLLGSEAFAAAAQSYGLLDSITWTVLQKGIACCREWQEQGWRLQLSFSLSGSSLSEPDLGKRIERLVRAAGLEPRRIVIGVPEDEVGRERAESLETLARLRVAGFGVAVEDVGSGASWGTRRAAVSFTEVRLGAASVSGVGRDRSAEAAIVVALDTAQRLKLQAVADGVSTIDQWNLLQAWGCAFAQGAFIGEPMAGADVIPWLDGGGRLVKARGPTGRTLELRQPDPGEIDGPGP